MAEKLRSEREILGPLRLEQHEVKLWTDAAVAVIAVCPDSDVAACEADRLIRELRLRTR